MKLRGNYNSIQALLEGVGHLKNRCQMTAPLLLQLWIGISALLCAGGWILSALHQLNSLGYSVLALAGSACCFWWWNRETTLTPVRVPRSLRTLAQRLRRRLSRPFPLAFLVLAALALLGGALYAPTNFDALAYRISRMLHWMTEGQWHWIQTYDSRMNSRSCGFEWLTMPLLVFSKSDRGFFLVNFISFLFLPGLVFSLLTQLGARPRVAWNWMWVVPSGYTFILQAGSIANDLFAAVYALAAVDFALRARQARRADFLWLSILAAALLTGSKSSNIPLLLPWFIALLTSVRLLIRKPLASVAVVLLAALISFLPNAVLNYKFSGDWTGYATEALLFMASNPIIGVAGNTLMLFIQNLVPPFFPFAGAWNAAAPKLIPDVLYTPLAANLEPGFLMLRELQQEEGAGLGLGLCLILIASVVAAVVYRQRRVKQATAEGRGAVIGNGKFLNTLVLWSPYVALLAFMAKSGINSAARLICPYYPLLLPALLAGPAHEMVVRQRWWRTAVLCMFTLALAVLILTPARPLWPARTVLTRLNAWKPGSRLLQRAEKVYSVYADRADGLAPVRALIPSDARVIGLVSSGGDTETSLWRPFGERKVRYILASDTAESLRRDGVNFIIVNSEGLDAYFKQTLKQWLQRFGAEVIGKVSITLTVTHGAKDWYLVKLS